MDKPILEIISVSKSFSRDVINTTGNREIEKYYILNDLNISIVESSITSIIGGNGVGKTTLFNLISNLEKPDIGNIMYYANGKKYDLNSLPVYKVSRLGIGRLFQNSSVFKGMTLLENMLVSITDRTFESPRNIFANRAVFKKKEKDNIEKALQIWRELLGTHNHFCARQNELAGTLSVGQQKLLGFSRLLMGDHRLILLDEPSAGINSEMSDQLTQMIKQLKEQKKTILLIEHNYEFIRNTAQYCYYLADGKIPFHGPTKQVLARLES